MIAASEGNRGDEARVPVRSHCQGAMRKHRKLAWKIALVCVFMGVAWYLVSVARPFDDQIKVSNGAGVPPERIEELVDYARRAGCFPEETIEKLRTESKWTPWSRAELFVDIHGTPAKVEVMAGFIGGPLYGGGRMFSAVWTGSAWQFSHATSWVS